MRNWFKKFFAGTLKLSRFVVRKERISSLIWVIALSVLSIAVAFAFGRLFKTPEELAGMASMFENPAMAAMLGPIFGALTTETLYTASMLLYVGIAVGLMNIFFVIRNTRAEEEKGREEVIRSLPVGRLSNMAATLIIAFAVNLILCLVTFVGLLACGFAATGAILFGLALFSIGMFFAGMSAVFCQLFSESRIAVGFSVVLLIFFYVLRGVGDVSPNFIALSYLSPLGLMMHSEVFASNLLWPLVVLWMLSIILCLGALWLNTKRDMGRGLINEKPGKREASFLLKNPEGFLFKLMRNGIIIWFVGMFLLGIAYGAVMGEMESFIEGNEFMKNLLLSRIPEGHSLTEAFITMVVDVMILLAVIPALMAILKMASEEKTHRYENILSKAVSRPRLLTAHLIHAFLQSVLMLFAVAFGMWISSALVMDTPITFGNMMVKFFAYLPATFAMLGLAALLAGVIPKLASVIAFGYLGVSFFANYLGPLLGFPDWFKYLTPYGAIPNLLEGTVSLWPFVILTVLSIGLTAGSYFAYSRRDLL